MQTLRKIIKLFGGKNESGPNKPLLLVRLALILVAFAVLMFFAQLWNASRPVKTITISGTSILAPQEVKAAIDSKAILNVPKNKIKYSAIAQNLKNNPFIEETFMHEGIYSLDIEIKERYPAAILANDYGELLFADSRGLLLPYRLFSKAIDMPIISGVFDGEKLDTTSMMQALDIIKIIKSEKYHVLYNQISEIHYNFTQKTFELFTSDFGTTVKLGDISNIEGKISNLYDFFEYKLKNEQSKNLKYIDARWAGNVIAKYQQT